MTTGTGHSEALASLTAEVTRETTPAAEAAIAAQTALAERFASVQSIETEEQEADVASVHAAAGEEIKRWESVYKPILSEIQSSLDGLKAQFNDRRAPLENLRTECKRLLGAYSAAKRERERQAEVARRQMAEEQARREQAERAAELELAGRSDEAERLLAEPPPAPVVTAISKPSEAPKSYIPVTRWDYQIIDPGQLAENYLQPRQPAKAAIRAEVNRVKKAAAQTTMREGATGPAIRVFKVETVRDR